MGKIIRPDFEENSIDGMMKQMKDMAKEMLEQSKKNKQSALGKVQFTIEGRVNDKKIVVGSLNPAMTLKFYKVFEQLAREELKE